jgi:hypothetical protein
VKKCWKCGAEISCCAPAPGCWCESYPALPPVEGADCLCPECLAAALHIASQPKQPLIEGEHYYTEGSAMVFTAAFHLQRGYCCGSGCRHCPYRD